MDVDRLKPVTSLETKDATFPPAFQSIIFILKISGFDITMTNTSKSYITRVIFKIYQIILSLFSVFFMVLIFNELYHVVVSLLQSTKWVTAWVFYCDSVFVFTIFIHHAINGSKIRSFFNELALLAQSLDDIHRSSFRQTRRWATGFTIHCILVMLIHFSIVTMNSTQSDHFLRNAMREYYLGISGSNPVAVKTLYVIFETLCVIISICAYAYSWLLILIVHTLTQCFQQLNNDLRSRTNILRCQEIQTFQKKHQMIVNLVNEFNVVFSPVVLIYVVFNTIQAITGYDLMKTIFKEMLADTVHVYDQSWLTIIKVIVFIISIAVTSGKLMFEVREMLMGPESTSLFSCFSISLQARETINIFLNMGLNNRTFYETHLQELCKVRRFGVAELLISPLEGQCPLITLSKSQANYTVGRRKILF